METEGNYKRIAVLGSTGSIGTQTLDVIESHPERFKATILIAGSKVDTLIQQCIRHRPSLAIIADETKLWKLRDALAPLGIDTAAGADAVANAMESDLYDMVITATVGYSGLLPTLRAIAAGKDIGLANKETLVVAGETVTRLLSKSPTRVIPVDSEHSAIYQCLAGESADTVNRLIITASGGPFRTWSSADIATAKAADALKHPNWSMGAKITVDSASMLNKAFEIIEARWLFGIEPDRIVPVVHPQSIVHSMVEFVDGSIKAQLGVPDMRLPIRYALGDARRLVCESSHLTLEQMTALTFERPDYERFPALSLASYSLERGGNTACIINAANEVAVAAFLRDEITFGHIYKVITDTLGRTDFIAQPCYDDYVETNDVSRRVAGEIISHLK